MSVIGSLFALLASVIVLGISIILSILISQPFTGALVRLRANYLPKAVSLDNVLEDGALAAETDSYNYDDEEGEQGRGLDSNGLRNGAASQRSSVSPRAISAYFLRDRQSTAKIGPVVSGIIAMLTRTRRLEGWAGIYKGSAPVVCQLLLLGLVTLIFFSSNGGFSGAAGGAYRASPSGPGQFGFWTNLIFMVVTSIVALPLNVITNRAIVHPRILDLRRPRENLRELLSFSEYSQPWRLFALPGLLAAHLFHIAWIGFATRIVRHVTVPSLGGLPPSTPASPDQDTYTGPSSDGSMSLSAFGLSVFLAWCVLSVVVLSPVECIIIRLSVQRPERQQPLHLAYARVPAGGVPTGPAPYNNQATVSQSTRNESTFRDENGPANTDGAEPASAPTDPLPRPSFAVDDDDEDEDTGRQGQEAHKDAPAPKSDKRTDHSLSTQSANPQRVLDGQAPLGSNRAPYHRIGDAAPPEPVIALRPCDEPMSAEEAARVESQGFGAPTVERYQGMVDCLNKLVDEEGIEALYRGAWVTLLFMLAGNFS